MGTLIAKAVAERQLFDIAESGESLLRRAFPNLVASHDAKLAARAVLLEYQLGELADHLVPGFVGEDSFYE